MTALNLALAHAVKLALLAALVGVLARGRVRQCWVFPVYLLVVLITNSLGSFWPARFHTPETWVVVQGAYDLLKMAVVLELAWRAFVAFPGAMRSARVVLLLLLVASTVAIAFFTPPSSYATVWDFQPSIVAGTLWLLMATALLVVWYQIPVHDWQRAIMLGFAPYLLVFVVALDMLRRHGWSAVASAGLLDQFGYLALVVFWAWAAWRRDSATSQVLQLKAA
jgi:hypothetical protein